MAGKSKYTREIAIAASILVHGDKYDYTDSVFTLGRDSTLSMRCPVHGMFTIRLSGHIKKGYGCVKCGRENRNRPKGMIYKNTRTEEQFQQEANTVHSNRYKYPFGRFINMNTLTTVICDIHGPFEQLPYVHLRGAGCKRCTLNLSKRDSPEEHVAKAFAKHGNRFDYSVTLKTYVGSKKLATYHCIPHNNTFEQLPASHLKGDGGCRACFLEKVTEGKKLTHDEGIAKMIELHGTHRYSYKNSIYISYLDYMEVECLKHGPFIVTAGNHLMGSGCPSCSRSRGERYIEAILHHLKVEYIPEFRFSGYMYEYDFYLPDYQLFIEFHGKQHYYPVEFFGGREAFRAAQQRDSIKEAMVKTAGAQLVVFNYIDHENKTLRSSVKKLMKDRPKKPRDIPFYTAWLEDQKRRRPPTLLTLPPTDQLP